MRKLILRWLFGTDDIKFYSELLSDSKEHTKKMIDQLNSHLDTLDREKETINNLRKLIKICENHGIDVDKEIKNVEL